MKERRLGVVIATLEAPVAIVGIYSGRMHISLWVIEMS